MRRTPLLILLMLTGIFVFATQFVTLSASPAYLLPGNNVKLIASVLSTSDVKSVVLKMTYDSSTVTLYNPTISGKNYVWNYTPNEISDFEAQAEVSFNSTASKEISNVATFTTDIPAVSVNSTIVYIPFITNATQTWKTKIKNIGSKPLNFTTSSTPQALEVFPSNGTLLPQQEETFTITNNAFLLPGDIHILDAYVNTNDPRSDMKKLLLIRVIEGPDGLDVSPVSVSHTNVSVGSDISFNFSIFYNGITLENVTVTWNTPKEKKIFYFASDKTHFSSRLRLNYPGTYKLSSITIRYVYKNNRKTLVLTPNITVNAFTSPKDMDLNINKNSVGVNITSYSTPTLHVEDEGVNEFLNLTPVSSSTWSATYNYLKVNGPVTFYATFDDVDYVISKTFNRYIVNSRMWNLAFSDEDRVTIQKDTFSSTAMVVLFAKSLDEKNYYEGYQAFTPVSDTITLVSDKTPLEDLTYHLRFDLSMVNGLFDHLRIYKLENGKWVTDSATLTVQEWGMARFNEKIGTYVIGISPDVQSSLKPIITSFMIMPRKSRGGNVRFFLSVSKDCYYRLEIYDMRSKIVEMQTGEAIGNLNNLLYTLNTSLLPGGLYVAVVGVGSQPNVITNSTSRSFAIVK